MTFLAICRFQLSMVMAMAFLVNGSKITVENVSTSRNLQLTAAQAKKRDFANQDVLPIERAHLANILGPDVDRHGQLFPNHD